MATASPVTESSSATIDGDTTMAIHTNNHVAPTMATSSSASETPATTIMDENPIRISSNHNVENASVAKMATSSTSVEQIIPTSAIAFVESEHGRLRRMQRGIDKKDLQRAMKYGTRERNYYTTRDGYSTCKYTYNDIVYIVEECTGREITSYALPFPLDLVSITEEQRKEHEHFQEQLKHDAECWTSHLVLVVDTSGSMREADVWGARNRLQAVWLTIALDIIAARIESGEGGGTDAVSIITLAEIPELIIEEQPTTWVLYNQIAMMYNNASIQPYGHGPFLESLSLAREILERNTCASCAMNLMFLSDGRPSSEGYNTYEQTVCLILDEIRHLAKTLGRRLTFQAVGIGDINNFETLKKMVDEANDFGVTANICLPSMSTSGLGNVFSTIRSSLTSTQMELTNALTMKQEKVKTIQRESRIEASKPLQCVNTNQFSLYPLSSFRRLIYTETKIEIPLFEESGVMVDDSLFHGKRWKTIKEYKEAPPQHPDTKYIALATEAFGEGAERFAFRFFEVGIDGKTIIGNPMVAKESRFLMRQTCDVSHEFSDKYIEKFCSTQQLSRRLAKEFNDKLNKLHRVHPETPRVSFLDCSIYKIEERDGTYKKILVEDKLDHNRWRKWNSNNGYVEGMQLQRDIPYRELMKKVYKVGDYSSSTNNLNVINEGDEDESNDEKGQELDAMDQDMQKVFSPNEVAQAFSHFTYWATGRKRLVCDLQGVYDDYQKQLMLSDPVIHYHNPDKGDRRFIHGRTDKGEEGVKMFFATHKDYCGHLCKLVLRGLKPIQSTNVPTKN